MLQGIFNKNRGKTARSGRTLASRAILLAASLFCASLAPLGAAHAGEGNGTGSVTPSIAVAAGTSGTWTFRYTATDTFIDGIIQLVIPSGWTAPQISNSSAAGYVTVSTAGGVLGAPSLVVNGSTITVNITALDTSQTVDIVYGDASVSQNGKAIAQTTAQADVEFTIRSDPTGSYPEPIDISPQIDVVAAAITQLVFTTPARTITAGGETAVMRVRAQDIYGNGSAVPANQKVLLGTTSTAGVFSHLPGGAFAETDTVVITAGTDTVSFYCRDTKAGSHTVSAKGVGQIWTDASQGFTVQTGSPFKLSITPADTTATAGDYARFRIAVQDEYGNASTLSNNQRITLLGAPGSFYTTSNHATPITSIVISSGTASILVDYRNTTKDVDVGHLLAFLDNDGVVPTLESFITTIYIDNAAFSASETEIAVGKTSATANGSDVIPVTVTVRDAWGNLVDGSTVTIEMTGSGNSYTQPSGVTGASGVATGSARSTKAEGKYVKARVGGSLVADSAAVTYIAGPVNTSASTIALDKSVATADNADSIVVTVTALDTNSNPVSGRTVSIEATGSGNTFRQPSGTTAANGTAVGSMRSTKAEPKSIRARIDGVLINPTASAQFNPGSFSVATSLLAAAKSTAVADNVDTIQVTVTVLDAYGNPVSGRQVTLEATGTGNSYRQPAGFTGSDGIAVGAVRSTRAEAKTIRARVDGVLITASAAVSFAAGAFDASTSEIAAVPLTTVANGSDSIRVTVTAKDAFGNPISGRSITIEASPATGVTLRQPAAATGADGTAVGSVRSTKAEGKILRARVDGSYVTDTESVSFTPGAANRFVITHDGAGTAGVAEPVLVEVQDAQGNKVTGYSGAVTVYTSSAEVQDFITWSLGNASGSFISQNGDSAIYQFVPADQGDAELRIADLKVESVTIYAAAGAIISASASPLAITSAAADRIAVLSGGGQSAVVDAAVAAPLVAAVTDQYGNRVSGVTVTFSILSDNGGAFDADLSAPGTQLTDVTDAAGEARCEYWRLGTKSGTLSDTLGASIASGTTRSVVYAATALPGTPASIALAPASRNVTVSSRTTVTATLRDAFSNVVPGQSVTIFIKDAADGHLSAAAGFPSDSLGPTIRRGTSDAAGTVRISYDAPAGAGASDVIDSYHDDVPPESVSDVTYATTASGATNLRVTILSGGTSEAGATFSFRVEAVDGFDNLDPTNTSHILLVPPPAGLFTFSLTDFGAPVTAADLSGGAVTLYGRGSKQGEWQIEVRDGAGSLSQDAFPITIIPRTVIFRYLVTAPSNATAGADFSVTAEARDSFGNRVTTASNAISLRAVQTVDTTLAASGTLTPAAGALAAGYFAGSGFRYMVAEGMRVEVSDGTSGVEGVSGIVTVANALAYRLVAVSGDTADVAVGDSILLRVRVLDQYGNAVPAHPVQFSVLVGGGSFSTPSVVTNGTGAASAWFRTDTAVGTNRARAAILDGEPEELETQLFDVETRPRATIESVALMIHADTVQAGAPFTGDVAAYDAYGNLITTDNSSQLRPVAARASAAFTPTLVSLSGGLGSFSAADTIAGPNRIAILSIGGDTLAPLGDPYVVIAGEAYRIAEVNGDTAGVVAGSQRFLRAVVRDRYGNPVPGETVRFAITSSLGGSPSLWDATGAPADGIVVTNAGGTALCRLTTDANAGMNVVEATILDANPPERERVTFTVTAVAGSIARYDILPGALARKAGEHFNVQIIAYDGNDNEAVNDNTTMVSLGSSGSVSYGTSPVRLTAGRATVDAYDTKAERVVLRAQTQGGGAASESDTITVSPEVPSGAIGFASIDPDTITANGSSVSTVTTTPVRDAYANVVQTGSLVRVTATAGSIASEDANPGTPEIERATSPAGVASVFIRSAAAPGSASVSFQSVAGSAQGTAIVVFAPPPAIQYAGYLSPRFLVPTSAVQFKCSITNAAATGLYLTAASSISFADSIGNSFVAHLAAADFIRGSSTDTITFAIASVPAGMLGGTYSPRVLLAGHDVHDGPFSTEFSAGTNSVSISNIEIVSVAALKTIVSRGDTFDVDVRVRNGGGAAVTVNDLQLSFERGTYSALGAWNPALPNSLPAGAERTYRRSVYVLPASPIGADTIDAAVIGSAAGIMVQDLTAQPNTAKITVQSAASIAYVAGTLRPAVVSQGQQQSFSLTLRNDGEAAVLLDAAGTRFSFSDGVDIFTASLGAAGALPGGRSTTIVFPAAQIPAAMDPGNRTATVTLAGTENGAGFTATIVPGDPVTVVTPASLAYRAGSLTPAVVSKGSSVDFAVGVDNGGGGTVVCNPDSTTLVFSSGPTEYRAKLDGDRGRTVPPGGATLYFLAATVSGAITPASYPASVAVVGTENGIRFARTLSPAGAVTVQEPPQLSIDSTGVSQRRITADQTPSWLGAVYIKNNGQATVKLDSIRVRLFAGSADVGGEYDLTIIGFTPGVDVLGGGQSRAIIIRFDDDPGSAMTRGTVVIEPTVWGRDLNSGTALVATTESGGKGSYLVQSPAILETRAVRASVDTATVQQTRNWTVDVALRNAGESDIQLSLDPALTHLVFSTSSGFVVIQPTQLVGGAAVLEGGSTDTLRYVIDRTGSVAGVCTIEAATAGTELNSGRALASASGGGIRDEVLLETEAALQIVRLTPSQERVTVQQTLDWVIEMEVTNVGGSRVTLRPDVTDSTFVAIPGGTGFIIENPTALVGGGLSLPGGATGRLAFAVTTTGVIPAGMRVLTGAVLAVEDHSGRHLRAERTAGASTDSVGFDLRPDPRYAAGTLTPIVASSGTMVSFELNIRSSTAAHAALDLDRGETELFFGDADGDTFRAALSPVSPTVLPGGGAIRLNFTSTAIDTAIARGQHAAFVRLAGLENGNPFTSVISTVPDLLTIEEAPRLSISRIAAPATVTRSQTKPWTAWMVLRNNGEASVALDLDAAATRISFFIVGQGDRTSEYSITPPQHLSGAGTDTLAGGRTDSLAFEITATGSTPGLALVQGTVEAVDINSGTTLTDDTYSGGFANILIEEPGSPSVTATVPSRSAVTSGQGMPWQITLTVCNEGQASLTLALDSTYWYYGSGTPLAGIKPIGFLEGGLVLPGGACRSLRFTTLPTPVIPAGADIALHARVGFFEDNSGSYRFFDTRIAGSGSGTVRVQAPAALRVVSVANGAPRAPFVNAGQEFPIGFTVRNGGEATAALVTVALETTGGSSIADTLLDLGSIGGSTSAGSDFSVTAAIPSGAETFRARIRSAVDGNSGESSIVIVEQALDDTTIARIQQPSDLSVLGVVPSQSEVNASQAADWTILVRLENAGEAPLAIGQPAASDIAFSRGAVPLADYLVIPPAAFASGAPDLTLAGGERDSLVYVVASTGADTGMVQVGAEIAGTDGNDPELAPETAAGAATIRVKPPSGLRIISVTSSAPNNNTFPNRSVVNTDQVFGITVRVENTGGDDLDSVTVRLASSGGSTAAVVGDSLAYVASHSEHDYPFTVTAAPTPGIELLTAAIVRAVSVNTGERVIPSEAVESIENLRIQTPALLSCSAAISAPAGAIDDTLSAGQLFTVNGVVANGGEASIDTTGRMTISLPPGMTLGAGQQLTRRFAAGEAISWVIQAPSSPSFDTVMVSVTIDPRDVNTGDAAAVALRRARIPVRTEPAAGIAACAVSIAYPNGAVDGVLSTQQKFGARAVFTPSANADSVWVELVTPVGFAVTGDRVRIIGRGTGTPQTIDWIVDAPLSAVSLDSLRLRAGGKDRNAGGAIPPCRSSFPVRVVTKPVLSVTARISGPPEATDGVVSIDLPFTIEALVEKTGTASVDTAFARIELSFPLGQGYLLNGSAETYRKPFYPGVPVSWNVRAPGAPTSPGNIGVSFVEPYAHDVNTNAPAEIATATAVVPVQTEAGLVSMLDISAEDSIPPFVVPQGARDVRVMRVAFRNSAGYTIALDTLRVSLTDSRARLIANPARSVERITLEARSGEHSADVLAANPVPVVVAGGWQIEPGTSDTLLLIIDVAAAAPPGELRVEIARSEDVVMRIALPGGGFGPRVWVAWEVDQGDIAGHFRSGPLSVMSASFEEYVHNYPNPFRAGAEATKICYVLTEDATVTMKIYDLAGSLVWTKTIPAGGIGGTGSPSGSWWEIPWDGRNDSGEVVRNGVYLCKVTAGSRTAVVKIAVAK